ncbi:MAG: hypothetical protein IZT59_02185 [Verrucomicrobia bacterium]|nr:hypothetical protein [Verrucomicrobiota bacterium]
MRQILNCRAALHIIEDLADFYPVDPLSAFLAEVFELIDLVSHRVDVVAGVKKRKGSNSR